MAIMLFIVSTLNVTLAALIMGHMIRRLLTLTPGYRPATARYEDSCVLLFLAQLAIAPEGGGCWYLLFGWCLLALSWIDYHTLTLPDRLTLPFLLCGIAGVGQSPPLAERLHGALAGGGALLLLNGLYAYYRGCQGIGGGDIKLLAGMGAWLGWRPLPLLCCLAALIGLGCWSLRGANRGRVMAFGPCLALAGWLIYISPH